MAIGPVSPLLLERYELKYPIPRALVEPISRHIELYCEMDYYSQISPDHFYTINSLYLDTPSLLFFHRKEAGDPNYFSLRIRSYGDEPKAPYFFECKQKKREFCTKRRGKVMFDNFADLFENPEGIPGFDYTSDKHLRFFMERALYHNARPVILAQYRRKAYLSTCDDYARITFDRDLRFMPETTFNVRPVESRMSHYDHTDTFGFPGDNVILELKCERKIPLWFVDLIQKFELVQGGFSKFGGSMTECYGTANQEFAFHRRSRWA